VLKVCDELAHDDDEEEKKRDVIALHILSFEFKAK